MNSHYITYKRALKMCEWSRDIEFVVARIHQALADCDLDLDQFFKLMDLADEMRISFQ